MAIADLIQDFVSPKYMLKHHVHYLWCLYHRIVKDYGTEIKKVLEIALECYSRKDEETKYQVLNLEAR